MKRILLIMAVFLLLIGTASASTKLAPCEQMNTSGPENWGGTDRGFITTSYEDRILYDGNITQIKFHVGNISNLTQFNYTVWRKDGATYDKIGDSGDLIGSISNGVNIINIPAIEVQAGDYYGYRIKTLGEAYYPFAVDPDDNTHESYYVDGGATSETNYDWESQQFDPNIYVIEAYANDAETSSELFAKVAPYKNINYGSANWGGEDREFIQLKQNERIRQTGDITQIIFNVENSAYLTQFNYTVWRKDGATYDKVGDSGDLIGFISNGVNIINIPAIEVQAGDYYGYRIKTTGAANYPFYIDTSDNDHLTYLVNGGATSDINYDWESQSPYNYVYVIEGYVSQPEAVFIGDSIFAGHPNHYSFLETTATTDINSTIASQWSQKSDDATYQNMGIGSQTTTQIDARFYADVVSSQPTYAIIEGGVNDVAGAVSSATILNNYESMLQACQNENITPIVVLVLPWTNGNTAQMQQIDTLNEDLETLVENYNGIAIDASTYVGEFRTGGDADNLWDIQAAYNADGVHYNGAGHERIAQAIVDGVNNQGTQISIQARITQNGNPLTSVVFNDEDNTGGFMNEYGRKTLSPNTNQNKIYSISLIGSSLADGFIMEITADGNDVTAAPLTINNLVPSRNYDIYLDNQFIERIGEVPSYSYNFTSFSTHTLKVDYVTGSTETTDDGASASSGPIGGDEPTQDDEGSADGGVISENGSIIVGEILITHEELETLTIEEIQNMDLTQEQKDELIKVISINSNWWKVLLLACLFGVIRECNRKEGNGAIIAVSVIGIVASAYKLGFA